jgi:hypothetical protein
MLRPVTPEGRTAQPSLPAFGDPTSTATGPRERRAHSDLALPAFAMVAVRSRREYCQRTAVLRQPLKIALGGVRDARKVEVVVQIGDLYTPANRVATGALNEGLIVVLLLLTHRDRIYRGDHGVGETLFAKALEGPADAILDDIMQNTDDALLLSFQRQHHS